MKIGDKVQFLSEIGGGKIAGFQGKDILHLVRLSRRVGQNRLLKLPTPTRSICR